MHNEKITKGKMTLNSRQWLGVRGKDRDGLEENMQASSFICLTYGAYILVYKKNYDTSFVDMSFKVITETIKYKNTGIVQ